METLALTRTTAYALTDHEHDLEDHEHDAYVAKDYDDDQDRAWNVVAENYTDDAVKNHTHDDFAGKEEFEDLKAQVEQHLTNHPEGGGEGNTDTEQKITGTWENANNWEIRVTASLLSSSLKTVNSPNNLEMTNADADGTAHDLGAVDVDWEVKFLETKTTTALTRSQEATTATAQPSSSWKVKGRGAPTLGETTPDLQQPANQLAAMSFLRKKVARKQDGAHVGQRGRRSCRKCRPALKTDAEGNALTTATTDSNQ